MQTMRYYWNGSKIVEIGQYSDNGYRPTDKLKAIYKGPGPLKVSDNAETFNRLEFWNGDKTINSLKLFVINAQTNKRIGEYTSTLNVVGDKPSGTLAKDERKYANTDYEVRLPLCGEYKLQQVIIWDENANDGSAVIHNQGVYETRIFREFPKDKAADAVWEYTEREQTDE